MNCMRLASTLLALLPLACQPGDEDLARNEKPLRIEDTWDVAAMTCDGADVEVEPIRYFKLDDSHVVRVETLSEDDASACLLGYFYTLSVSSDGDDYVEARRIIGTAVSTGTKTSCYELNDGEWGALLSEETGQFGPEQIPTEIVVSADGVTLSMEGTPKCPEGVANIELVRREQ